MNKSEKIEKHAEKVDELKKLAHTADKVEHVEEKGKEEVKKTQKDAAASVKKI